LDINRIYRYLDKYMEKMESVDGENEADRSTDGGGGGADIRV
jgi:hypothetical protein